MTGLNVFHARGCRVAWAFRAASASAGVSREVGPSRPRVDAVAGGRGHSGRLTGVSRWFGVVGASGVSWVAGIVHAFPSGTGDR
jgi:hypothetical protein